MLSFFCVNETGIVPLVAEDVEIVGVEMQVTPLEVEAVALEVARVGVSVFLPAGRRIHFFRHCWVRLSVPGVF